MGKKTCKKPRRQPEYFQTLRRASVRHKIKLARIVLARQFYFMAG
jgi:hypothetical protein